MSGTIFLRMTALPLGISLSLSLSLLHALFNLLEVGNLLNFNFFFCGKEYP